MFNFIDDPTWRNAISEFSYTHSAHGSIVYKFTNISVTSGQIVLSGHYFLTPGTWVITVKATGYPDTVLTVVSY
ncbi:MAG: hemoblobin-interacting domain-containing protein [Lysinibacillus sp.]